VTLLILLHGAFKGARENLKTNGTVIVKEECVCNFLNGKRGGNFIHRAGTKL
jgi:hypothetical protein